MRDVRFTFACTAQHDAPCRAFSRIVAARVHQALDRRAACRQMAEEALAILRSDPDARTAALWTWEARELGRLLGRPVAVS